MKIECFLRGDPDISNASAGTAAANNLVLRFSASRVALQAEAFYRSEKWVVGVLEATLTSSGRTISLTVDEKPGKAEKEHGADRN